MRKSIAIVAAIALSLGACSQAKNAEIATSVQNAETATATKIDVLTAKVKQYCPAIEKNAVLASTIISGGLTAIGLAAFSDLSTDAIAYISDQCTKLTAPVAPVVVLAPVTVAPTTDATTVTK